MRRAGAIATNNPERAMRHPFLVRVEPCAQPLHRTLQAPHETAMTDT
jgi:hypothetical protein